ncbi:tRNA pseudouridine(55) synthase TruB [Rhodohalobacter sp. SW132]|uniref:tRNA pseudouridine(55) synthase TruB n=1 Tax=Rhodohalobacter sp. SW132 TaxID=2293433 RepID=UPI000E22BF02|nr:tRNA pseudouridine(55) synthase TruB [Rhodohalobacter sp. SW132]REL33627.1 tRNA pseudouridine(55) synthase TruB [Rhodohalobacter sp. SW132]
MAKQVIPIDQLPVVAKNSAIIRPDSFTTGAAILMDKPLGWSSFDVVRYIRNRVPPKKVGHAGTLDPLATGLLIICTGKATRTISQFQDGDKVYETTVRFGSSTPSYDAALEPDEHSEWEHITKEEIENVIKEKFTGTIVQSPPIYSAIRVEGERLYKKARRGEKVTTPPRQVTIDQIEILDCRLPEVDLRIRCGKGTYIRSIGHDLGLELNSRAHLTALRRTAIGDFFVDDALLPEEFDQKLKK